MIPVSQIISTSTTANCRLLDTYVTFSVIGPSALIESIDSNSFTTILELTQYNKNTPTFQGKIPLDVTVGEYYEGVSVIEPEVGVNVKIN